MHAARLIGLAIATLVAALLLLMPPHVVQPAPLFQIDDDVLVDVRVNPPGQQLHGAVDVLACAGDRRSTGGPGLNPRDSQVWLNDWSDERNLLGYASLGNDPTGSCRAPREPAQLVWETCTFPPGPYTVTVWTSSLVVPGARNYGSLDAEVLPCASSTQLHRDDLSRPGSASTLRAPGPPLGRGPSSMRHPAALADFAAGIDARCVEPGLNCRYGLRFRSVEHQDVDRDRSYVFRVDPTDGTFSLRYRPAGEESGASPVILDQTQAPAIARGTATNRLGVVAQGDWLRLFVNGVQVGEARDARRRWGQIIWFADTVGPGSSVEVQFGNFIVYTVGPVDTLGPALQGQ